MPLPRRGLGARPKSTASSLARAAGARNRTPSIAPDLKALLQAALGKKLALTIGDKERILTRAARTSNTWSSNSHAAIAMLGDLFDLADKLRLDLGASSKADLDERPGDGASQARTGLRGLSAPLGPRVGRRA